MSVAVIVVAVVMLVTITFTQRSLSLVRAGQVEQQRLAAAAALDVAVADAAARIGTGAGAVFSGVGDVGAARWAYRAVPAGGAWTVTATASAGVEARTAEVAFASTGIGGWRQVSWRELPPMSPFAAAVLGSAGLEGWWRFDETSGTTIRDWSGNGRDGTVAGGVTLGEEPGPVNDPGRSARFNGSTGLVSVGDVLDFAGRAPYTVAAWVRPETQLNDWPRIVAKEVFGPRHGWNLLVWRDNANRPSAERQVDGTSWDGSNWPPVAAGGLTSGEWAHVVGAYDGTRHRVYVNGVLAADAPDSRSLVDTAGSLTIGNVAQGWSPWTGRIDDVTIWSRALSPMEVGRLASLGRTGAEPAGAYAQAVLASGALEAYWPLDETSGTTAFDASGNGRHGTYSGSVTLGGSGATRDGRPAPTFNGTTSQIDAGDVLDLAGRRPYTVAAWIRPGTQGSSFPPLVGKLTGAPRNGWYLAMRASDNAVFGERWVADATAQTPLSTVAPAAQWTFVAVSYDGGTIRSWVNGQLVSSVGDTRDLADTAAGLVIGRYGTATFVGGIDEVSVWSRALTAAELAALYAAGS